MWTRLTQLAKLTTGMRRILNIQGVMHSFPLQGYNTGYRYKGLGMLEPGTGTPTTNRRDRIKTSGEQFIRTEVYALYA